jgi:hypothetical protein
MVDLDDSHGLIPRESRPSGQMFKKNQSPFLIVDR